MLPALLNQFWWLPQYSQLQVQLLQALMQLVIKHDGLFLLVSPALETKGSGVVWVGNCWGFFTPQWWGPKLNWGRTSPAHFSPSPSLNKHCMSGKSQELAVPFFRLPSRLQVCGSEVSIKHNSTVDAQSVNYFTQKRDLSFWFWYLIQTHESLCIV